MSNQHPETSSSETQPANPAAPTAASAADPHAALTGSAALLAVYLVVAAVTMNHTQDSQAGQAVALGIGVIGGGLGLLTACLLARWALLSD